MRRFSDTHRDVSVGATITSEGIGDVIVTLRGDHTAGLEKGQRVEFEVAGLLGRGTLDLVEWNPPLVGWDHSTLMAPPADLLAQANTTVLHLVEAEPA